MAPRVTYTSVYGCRDFFSMYTLKRIGIEVPESALFCTCALSYLWTNTVGLSAMASTMVHLLGLVAIYSLPSMLFLLLGPFQGERTKYSIPCNPDNILPRIPCLLNAATQADRLLVGCLVMDTNKNYIWFPCLIICPYIKGSLLVL